MKLALLKVRLLGLGGVAALFVIGWQLWDGDADASVSSEEERRGDLIVPAPSEAARDPADRPQHVKQHVAAADWTNVKGATALSQVFDEARTSGNPEQVYTALRLASICLTVPKEDLDRDTAMLYEGDPSRQRRLIDAVSSARQQLTSFCQTGDSAAFSEGVRLKAISAEGASLKAKYSQRERADGPLNQWETMILANPQAYPLGIDTWLQTNIKSLMGDGAQVADLTLRNAVAEEVYTRLIGPSSPDSIRQLSKCAVKFDCSAMKEPTDQQSEEVTKLASDIEGKIRRQEWTGLAPVTSTRR
jgi:hypothetical protein